MAEHHEDPTRSAAPHRGELRSAAFERRGFAETMREAARKSPYLVIAVSLNLLLIGFATIWKMSEDSKRSEQRQLSGVIRLEDAKPIPPPEIERPDIFTQKDDDRPVDDSDVAIDVDSPTLEAPEDAIYSDHPETANDDDFASAKGNSNDAPRLGPTGEGLFTEIGVGGGSDRGGTRGFGGPFGGKENLYVRSQRKGTTKERESAVEAGLRWLARHQNDDGSWSPDGFLQHCQGGTICEGKGYPEHQVGLTGLALLAFLGAGYDHMSPKAWTDPFTKKTIRMGDVVKRGLKWLRASQDETGSFCSSNSKWGYNHSIATLAMAEAYGLSRNPGWRDSAQRGVDALVAAQNPAPGSTGLLAWRYRPHDGENDISVTGWAVMALKSAELAQLKYSRGSMEGAFNFCEEVTDKATGKVGYTKREEAGQQVKSPGKNDEYLNHPALTAVAMCVRTFTQHNVDDPMLEAGAKLLVLDLPAWSKPKKSNDFYYWYYGSLALNQFDGPDSPRAGKGQYWSQWNQAMTKALLDTQAKSEKLCQDGSWDADDRWGFEGGRVYATAINTLTFEVYYRYPNVFGRRPAAGVKK